MTSRPQIAVGIDGTSRGDDALTFASVLADAYGSGLLLVHAYGPGEDRAQARAMLDSRRAGTADRIVEAVAYADSSPARALHRVASARGARVIVVGPSHRARLGLVMPGTTGQQLLSHAPCPVAVVPRGWLGAGDSPLRRIGCGYDGSPEAKAALDAAAGLARLVGGKLEVMRAFWSPAPSGPQGVALAGDLQARAQTGLGEAVQALPADLDARAKLLLNDPAHALIARSRELDLLVLGSRGHSPLGAVWAGSVSGRVMRDASCPVLVVPRGVRPAHAEPPARTAAQAR